MAVLPPLSSPANAWRDLTAFLRAREKHQLLFGGLAILMPLLIVIGFYIDSQPEPQGPVTIYVENFNGPRPDSVIIARQAIEKVERDKALAARRAEWQRLEKKLGM